MSKMEINIDELIMKQIEDIDFTSIARDEIRDYVRRETVTTIKKMIEEEVQKIIQGEITKVMAGEVTISDGWGKTSTLPSFEDLFKQKLKEAMNKSWDAQKEIEKQVTIKVDALIKGEMKAIVNKIADALIKVKGE